MMQICSASPARVHFHASRCISSNAARGSRDTQAQKSAACKAQPRERRTHERPQPMPGAESNRQTMQAAN
jgi:hypothetical protein